MSICAQTCLPYPLQQRAEILLNPHLHSQRQLIDEESYQSFDLRPVSIRDICPKRRRAPRCIETSTHRSLGSVINRVTPSPDSALSAIRHFAIYNKMPILRPDNFAPPVAGDLSAF